MSGTEPIGRRLLYGTVVEMLVDILAADEDQITPETKLVKDLGAIFDDDSLRIRHRAGDIVRQDIPADDRWNKLISQGTVNDLVQYLYELQGEI